ncbi:MAG: hypothetical protein ABSA58_07590 [Acetobacteraceae bacterium]
MRTLPVMTLALAACSASPEADIADAQQHYLAAKARCIATYPRSLVLQSDCRTQAANTYVRPYYRYGDLMTWAQEQRRALAVKADRHEMSRAAYDREIARSEREVAREEERRNALNHTGSSYEDTPFASVFGKLTRIFQ